ncbi:MAG: M48 family metallopeptidase [Clostridia bacterium]|nr:M48 family metallopeptidase [Clostridia bacterium]
MGNISVRAVSYKGTIIEYTLERKAVKNINLRVRPDKSVYVSANSFVPVSVIDEFVSSKGAMILRAKKSADLSQKAAPAHRRYKDGEAFCFLGKTFYLKKTSGSKEAAFTDGQNLCLIQKDVSDAARSEKLVGAFTLDLCKNVFSALLKKRYPDFAPYTRGLPTLRIRTMKSRWGSCIPAKNVITLNTRLIEKPPDVIDYVVLHEYCHFVHPNHSKAFHALVGRFMPDWKKRKALLNSHR